MNNEFMLGRHNTVVPEYIMEVMRQRRFLDEDDTSEDAEILEMSGLDFLDNWLEWEGICNYTSSILQVIEIAYGIDLENWPFDETIERGIGD